MSFCFGFISNDPNLTGCAVAAFRDVLVLPGGAPNGWGMGYYQVGQPLLRRQPRTPPGPLDFVKIAENLRTNLIVGHVRQPTVGGVRTENTHPFRFRNWMFCHSGTIERFDAVRDDMLRSVPDFIRRNIRGNTDSEHLFHLFLSFLNDTGRMDDPRVPPDVPARALASTFAYLDRLVADHGGGRSDGCCILTNGTMLVGLRRSLPMRITRKNAFVCPGPDGRSVRKENLRAVVLVAGASPESAGWEEVADGSLVASDGTLNIQYLAV